MNTIDLFPYLCYIRIMKRSQIKNVISSFLYENGVEPEDADVKADELLKELEELGMKPPQNSTLGCRDVGMTADTFRWESEE